ncbi:HD domain-containing phosphohydrolase [Anatilimnocola sp. NA78]|uniref:HD-GYP domain-containing protein n=1 Tax=Anatilimnocola sp. NA78 TaxID=3415683 RepID=UPI003CE5678E
MSSITDSPAPLILVVDDEPLVRDVLTRWLRAEGFRCLSAADAESAWQQVQEQAVDLVTSDINMPGVSGIQLLARLQAADPDQAVLMLTGCGETSTAIRALTQGACGYLLKPVQREEMIFQVRQGLERTQLRKERRRYTEELERRVQEQTQTIRSAHEETIHRLVTASSFRDEETGAHIRRTGLFSEALARAAGWSRGECERLRMAAPMHDVGKIGIPDSILQRPGRLTPDEFAVMKTHTTIGAQMLQGSSSPMLKLAHEIALNHHEKWDGTGYPQGIRGEEIPESARILAIVDVYDALTHDRVYRKALPHDEVLTILRQGRETHFDPGLLGMFFAILEEIQQISMVNPDVAFSAESNSVSQDLGSQDFGQAVAANYRTNAVV